jgi:hypothetical protein
MDRKRNAYKLIFGNPQRRCRHRWEDNIKMDFEERDCKM